MKLVSGLYYPRIYCPRLALEMLNVRNQSVVLGDEKGTVAAKGRALASLAVGKQRMAFE